jgi:protease I
MSPASYRTAPPRVDSTDVSERRPPEIPDGTPLARATNTGQAGPRRERRVGSMALIGRKALLLAADDFEDMELLYPLYHLREAEMMVTVAGLDDQPVTGKKGHGPVAVDTTVDRVAAADFDALVIPGGYAPDKLRRSGAVLALVRAFDAAGKPIAFIRHAGWVPISAKILKGRRATSVAAIRDDMMNAGADWVDQATVVDGNLISARTPADLGPWMKALLATLEKTED